MFEDRTASVRRVDAGSGWMMEDARAPAAAARRQEGASNVRVPVPGRCPGRCAGWAWLGCVWVAAVTCVLFSYFNLWRTLPHANTHDFSSTHSNIANTAPPTACKRKVVRATSKDSRLTTPAPRTATSNGRASRAALTRTPSSASVRRSSAQSSRSQPAARQRAARPLRLDEGRGPHLFKGLAPQPLRL